MGRTETAPGHIGRGRGGPKGAGRGTTSGASGGRGNATPDMALELAELDDGSIAQESNIEILRAQRAAQRCGRFGVQDTTRENEGVDEEDPHNSIYDGIRLEPFNMRREMAEGHFDEGGFYILNKEEEKEVTDAWLDTVDKASKAATFQKIDRQQQVGQATASRLTALSRNLGEPEEKDEADEKEVESEKEATTSPNATKRRTMSLKTQRRKSPCLRLLLESSCH